MEVTYTVDPREVQQHLELWRPAIEKEVSSAEVAICKLLPGSKTRTEWLHRPGAQRLPTKLVFTVKPGSSPDPSDSNTWYKRKARLVVCGNYASADGSDLFRDGSLRVGSHGTGVLKKEEMDGGVDRCRVSLSADSVGL